MILQAKGRADSLTNALDAEFGGRGYKFSLAFSGDGENRNVVKSLSGGPTRLTVYGVPNFEEAMKLDRELHERFDERKVTGIEVLYEIHTEWDNHGPLCYPASMLARSAEFYADIKRRKQADAMPSAIRPESESDDRRKSPSKAEDEAGIR